MVDIEYNVNEHGTITDPGKFEGEASWVPKAWDMTLEGTWEQDGSVDTGMHYSHTEADAELIAELGLDDDTAAVVIRTDSQGFVYGETMNEDEYETFLANVRQEAVENYESEIMMGFAAEPDWLWNAYEIARENTWDSIGVLMDDGWVWYHAELSDRMAERFGIEVDENDPRKRYVVLRVSDLGQVEGALLEQEQYEEFLGDPEDVVDDILPDPKS